MKGLGAWIGVVIVVLTVRVQAGEVVYSADFERSERGKGAKTWNMFVPEESKDKGCSFEYDANEPRSGKYCAKLDSLEIARFAISSGSLLVKPGQRYRLTAWIKVAPSTEAKPRFPGLAFRMRFLKEDGQNVADNAVLFVGPSGKVVGTYSKFDELVAPLPQEWTQIDALFDIPAPKDEQDVEVKKISVEFFSWYGKGAIYLDDLTIEEAEKETYISLMPATMLPFGSSK